MAGGLFDDLPAPEADAKAEAKKAAAATTAAEGARGGHALPKAASAKSSLKKTAAARLAPEEGAGAPAAKKQKKGVRFGDEAGMTGVTVVDALNKIQKHIADPKKCHKSKSSTTTTTTESHRNCALSLSLARAHAPNSFHIPWMPLVTFL